MFANEIKRWDTLLGWVVFFIALIVYGITVEPTGSFWDAGEYITTSAKLQVGHPPGAPLLQMIGAFFAMFASDTDTIAKMVNSVSVASTCYVSFATIVLKREIYSSVPGALYPESINPHSDPNSSN